jgi:hypothetical protein
LEGLADRIVLLIPLELGRSAQEVDCQVARNASRFVSGRRYDDPCLDSCRSVRICRGEAVSPVSEDEPFSVSDNNDRREMAGETSEDLYPLRIETGARRDLFVYVDAFDVDCMHTCRNRDLVHGVISCPGRTVVSGY